MEVSRELKWKSHTELNGIYAEPKELKWYYFILTDEKGKTNFSVLDIYDDYAPGYPKMCKSIEEAQEKANQHYQSLLKKFVA